MHLVFEWIMKLPFIPHKVITKWEQFYALRRYYWCPKDYFLKYLCYQSHKPRSCARCVPLRVTSWDWVVVGVRGRLVVSELWEGLAAAGEAPLIRLSSLSMADTADGDAGPSPAPSTATTGTLSAITVGSGFSFVTGCRGRCLGCGLQSFAL